MIKAKKNNLIQGYQVIFMCILKEKQKIPHTASFYSSWPLREYKLFYCAQNNKRPFYPTFKANHVIFTSQIHHFTIPIYDYNYCRVINVHGPFSFFLTILYYKICILPQQLNFSLPLPFHACKTSNLVLSFWEWESPPRTPKAQEH